jgi:hypothetical protein
MKLRATRQNKFTMINVVEFGNITAPPHTRGGRMMYTNKKVHKVIFNIATQE